jgi:hypothetical protein
VSLVDWGDLLLLGAITDFGVTVAGTEILGEGIAA